MQPWRTDQDAGEHASGSGIKMGRNIDTTINLERDSGLSLAGTRSTVEEAVAVVAAAALQESFAGVAATAEKTMVLNRHFIEQSFGQFRG